MDSRAEPGSGAASGGAGGVINFFVILGVGIAAYGFLGVDRRVDAELSRFLVLFGSIWAVVGLGLGVMKQRMLSRAQAEQELFASGTRAVAVVEGVRTTGVVLNNINQQVVLTLRVQPQGEPEFPYERRLFVPIHALPRPGDVIDVAYDPADSSRVALATDWSNDTGGGQVLLFRHLEAGEKSAAGGGVVDELERLDRLRQSGSLTFAEFEALKAKILSGQGG